MHSRQSRTKEVRGPQCRDGRNGKASEGRGALEQLPQVKDRGAEQRVGGSQGPGRGGPRQAQGAAERARAQEGGEDGTSREPVRAFYHQNGHWDRI